MNHFDSSLDDYEDVPSPFQSKATRTSSRSTNMFSRPVGTVPAEAPVVTTTTRRRPARSMEEFEIAPKRKALAAPVVDYLDDSDYEVEEEEEIEEEEEVERRPAVRTRTKTKSKAKNKTQMALLPRIGWGIAVVMLLRLIFMERGVLQYWRMNGTITEHEQELVRVKKENAEISAQVHRAKYDKTYQRQLAKEQLGVIAADEFLILFAGEAQETETSNGRLL